MDKSNSTDESQHQDDEHSRRVSLLTRPPRRSPSTPPIRSLTRWSSTRRTGKLDPNATIRFGTTQVSESDLRAPRETGPSSLRRNTAIHKTALRTRTVEVRIEAARNLASRAQIEGEITKTVAMTNLGRSLR